MDHNPISYDVLILVNITNLHRLKTLHIFKAKKIEFFVDNMLFNLGKSQTLISLMGSGNENQRTFVLPKVRHPLFSKLLSPPFFFHCFSSKYVVFMLIGFWI